MDILRSPVQRNSTTEYVSITYSVSFIQKAGRVQLSWLPDVLANAGMYTDTELVCLCQRRKYMIRYT